MNHSAKGYLIELHAALELTERGDKYLYEGSHAKYGARVYVVGHKILIKQTVLRGVAAEYVIDEHKERHVEPDNDTEIACAIRQALKNR